MKEFLRFLRQTRMGYLLFTSLIILVIIYGGFEVLDTVFLSHTSPETMRWLYLTRGVTVSLLLMVWAAWTVYSYREIYQKRIEKTEGYYEDIVQHSADAIVALDVHGIITAWNQGASEMLGWNEEEMVGESVQKIIPADLLGKGELDDLAAEMSERGHILNYETERLHKSGKRILVSLTESLIKNEKGKVIGRSKILRDLTDIRMREEQIQQSERLATVGHMAAGVAHEVGNPLTAISSLVQVCQRKTDDPFIQGQLAKVRDHIQRINKIVRDLVDFSRPSSMQKERVNVNEIIKSAVGLLQHDARCRDVDFQLRLSKSLPAISCVPDQIHQVLVNLLLNAVDAMKGQKKPRVTISTERDENDIMLTVADDGHGIKEEHQGRIFEPFFTTKEVGSGTGLGLSVSHGIIMKLGGTISVKSDYENGATFIIQLPIKEA